MGDIHTKVCKGPESLLFQGYLQLERGALPPPGVPKWQDTFRDPVEESMEGRSFLSPTRPLTPAAFPKRQNSVDQLFESAHLIGRSLSLWIASPVTLKYLLKNFFLLLCLRGTSRRVLNLKGWNTELTFITSNTFFWALMNFCRFLSLA